MHHYPLGISTIWVYPQLQSHSRPYAYEHCFGNAPVQHHGQPPPPVYAHRAHLQPSSTAVMASAKLLVERCQPSEVFFALRQFSQLLRQQGWTALISDCGKRGEYVKAREVFRAVPKKNVWHHSALIAALGACGLWQEALGQLQKLKANCGSDPTLQPNIVTYSAAIAACARVQRIDCVLQLFGEMEDVGLKPDSVTYHIVLSTCARLGAWQQVASLLHATHSEGLAARPPIYSSYMRYLCRSVQWNKAVGLFLVMQDLGVAVTPQMVVELLQTLNRCNRPRMAAHLLVEAEDSGLVSCIHLYDTAFKGLLDAGCTAEAQELHDHMMSSGHWPARPIFQQYLYQQKQQKQQQQAPAPGGSAAAAAAAAAAAGGEEDEFGASLAMAAEAEEQQEFEDACQSDEAFLFDCKGASSVASGYAASNASSSELSSSAATLSIATTAVLSDSCVTSSSTLASPECSPTCSVAAAAGTPFSSSAHAYYASSSNLDEVGLLCRSQKAYLKLRSSTAGSRQAKNTGPCKAAPALQQQHAAAATACCTTAATGNWAPVSP